ncbi:hypothetical protein VU02_05005, partial [Desulfobulbus sp. N2]|nr:hypothetical protein [Desulfobulbus sp. N2]
LGVWGYNYYGQVGTPSSSTSVSVLTPIRIGFSRAWSAIAARASHSLAIKNGNLWAWGDNRFGQLAYNSSGSVPMQVGSDNDWTTIATGTKHSLAIKNSELWTWGNNEFGQLGIEIIESRIPLQITTLIKNTFNPAILLLLL